MDKVMSTSSATFAEIPLDPTCIFENSEQGSQRNDIKILKTVTRYS